MLIWTDTNINKLISVTPYYTCEHIQLFSCVGMQWLVVERACVNTSTRNREFPIHRAKYYIPHLMEDVCAVFK